VLRAMLLVGCLIPGGALAQAVAEPGGYRAAPYAAPVPEGLSGATTVDVEEARRLWEEGEVAFIDVLPREPKPADLPEGTIWQGAPARQHPWGDVAAECWLRGAVARGAGLSGRRTPGSHEG
jgi:hypothetical protein